MIIDSDVLKNLIILSSERENIELIQDETGKWFRGKNGSDDEFDMGQGSAFCNVLNILSIITQKSKYQEKLLEQLKNQIMLFSYEVFHVKLTYDEDEKRWMFDGEINEDFNLGKISFACTVLDMIDTIKGKSDV